MSNIIKNYNNAIDFRLSYDEYWDFCLNTDISCNYEISDGIQTRCLVAYIDVNNPDCVWFDRLYSVKDYKWDESVNNGVDTNYVGYTGVDNGFVEYPKDRTSNERFYQLYTNSRLTIESGDMRFTMKKVYGNNMIYDYSSETVVKDGVTCLELNGGFYQGFFKLDGFDYHVLPDKLEDGICFEFVLNKSELEKNKENRLPLLNDRYPDNKGIFFYIGTRAENKWWINYITDIDKQKACNSYFSDSYADIEYGTNSIDSLNEGYFKPYVDLYNRDGYFSDKYLSDKKLGECDNTYFLDAYAKDGYEDSDCDKCDNYSNDDYYKEDRHIEENETTKTSEGYDFAQPNIFEIKTDNKFIFFNRTKDGFNVNTWNDGDEYVMTDIKIPNDENYFTMFDRTDKGFNINNIDVLLNEKSKKYDVLGDLYKNAFSLQIKDSGSIGYKYLVRDCEDETRKYKIESEFSADGIIHDNMWYDVQAKIIPINNDSMRIYLYVNGKLCLMSKELPIIDLRGLNDLKDKQIGVPYNISLGGGTQGLCDVVYLNYRKLPEYVLPLEKEFVGTFIGYIRSFKMYDCSMTMAELKENVIFEIS